MTEEQKTEQGTTRKEEIQQPETKNQSEETSKKKTEKKQDSNIIFVGKKPFVNYIIAGKIQMDENPQNQVILKARGNLVSRAVDLAEVLKKGIHDKKVTLQSISIGSIKIENREKKEVSVSEIIIVLKKEE
jgi:DNA-binding protein